MKVLIANLGSTSFKYQLFDMSGELVLSKGAIERVGSPEAVLSQIVRDGHSINKRIDCPDHAAGIQLVLENLSNEEYGVIAALDEVEAIGLKVVHGGPVSGAVVISEEVVASMEEFTSAAPVHNPIYIHAIRIFQELTPAIPLIGLFETAFHREIPDHAVTYGIPYEWKEKYGIRKYGFHGASFRYVSERTAELVNEPLDRLKMIVCHLGGSSSVCALKDGRSIDTSMGFSAQSGVINAARNGDLDSFVIPFIMEKENLSPGAVRRMLTKESGLLGISGLSEDIRELEQAAAEGHERAKLALQVLVYDVKRYIGAYTAILNGLDVLAFTGGIGEKGMNIRRQICEEMEALGIRIDDTANESAAGEQRISPDNASVQVWVVPTNEELIVARSAVEVLS